MWTQLKAMRIEDVEGHFVEPYIKANFERNNPLPELWRSQIESIDKVNDPDRQSYCLKMPTGAGKTRVAELMILRFLLDFEEEPEAKCVYIAPFRSLASEIEQTLRTSFVNIPVSSFYGGIVDPFVKTQKWAVLRCDFLSWNRE